MINATSFRIIKSCLIILTVILILNAVFASLYLATAYPDSNNDLSDWLTLGANIAIDCLSIYLISQDNLIGDLIAFYQDFSVLQFDYNIGGYYGMNIFISSPQAIFTGLVNLSAVLFILIHTGFLLLKKRKGHLIKFNNDFSQQPSFITKHKLDLCLISFFAILIIFYWSLWAFLRYGCS